MRSPAHSPAFLKDRRLWSLFALALVLRVAFVAHHADLGWQLRFDPGIYLLLAENLEHGVYSMFHPLDIPDTIKMPGYPMLLWLLGGHVMLILLVQAFFSASKVILVFLLARHVGLKIHFAHAAAALMAIEPMDILLAGQVLTDSFFTLFLLSGTLLLLQGARWRFLLSATVLFATAAWIRPNGIWLIPLAGFASFFLVHRSVVKALAFTSLGVLFLLPWAWRNHVVLDRFYLGDAGVVAAGYYQVPQTLHAASDPAAEGWTRSLRNRASFTDWEDRKEFHAFFDRLRGEVFQTMREHPLTWTGLHAWKAIKILGAPGRGHIATFFGDMPFAARSILAISTFFSLLLVLSSLGWLMQLRRIPYWLWLVLMLSAYLIISGALTTTDARFKNPAMPLLLVGVVWLFQSSPWTRDPVTVTDTAQ